MLSCKDVAQLASESLDRSLSLREWLSLRLHILRCDMCSRYVDQLKFLRRVCSETDQDRTGDPAGLSEDARARIRRRLNQDR